MHNAKLLTFILMAASATVSSLPANTIQPSATLDLYSDRVRPVTHGAAMPPFGYYNPADPTLTYSNKTVSDSWTHGGHEDVRVSDRAIYQSQASVNKDKVLNVCPGGFCYDPGDSGHSNAIASGHANAQSLSIGAYSSARNDGLSMGALSDVEATVMTMFRVTSGASGLPDGTVVDLNWLYHLEGSTMISGRTAPDTTDVLADVSSQAFIRNLYSSGEGYDILASIDFDLNLQLSDNYPGQDTAYLQGSESWSAYSNAGFQHGASEDYDRAYSGSSVGVSRTVHVDSSTGIFGLDYVPFQATVGEWMVIEFDLNLYSSVSGGASPFGPMGYGSTYNDYFNTLTNNFQFAGPSQGLQLEFAGATPTATPEPGTICIAGLGMMVIGVMARRRVRVG